MPSQNARRLSGGNRQNVNWRIGTNIVQNNLRNRRKSTGNCYICVYMCLWLSVYICTYFSVVLFPVVGTILQCCSSNCPSKVMHELLCPPFLGQKLENGKCRKFIFGVPIWQHGGNMLFRSQEYCHCRRRSVQLWQCQYSDAVCWMTRRHPACKR